MHHYLVPAQQQGAERNIEEQVTAPTAEDAEDWFIDAKENLLMVNNWLPNATGHPVFTLQNYAGTPGRHARKGDKIIIHIRDASVPNPVDAGEAITICAIQYDDYPDESRETFALKISYSHTGSEATGTFVIERNGKMLLAKYHSRNETGDIQAQWAQITDKQLESVLKGFLNKE